jgi:hypothetical protein
VVEHTDSAPRDWRAMQLKGNAMRQQHGARRRLSGDGRVARLKERCRPAPASGWIVGADHQTVKAHQKRAPRSGTVARMAAAMSADAGEIEQLGSS